MYCYGRYFQGLSDTLLEHMTKNWIYRKFHADLDSPNRYQAFLGASALGNYLSTNGAVG